MAFYSGALFISAAIYSVVLRQGMIILYRVIRYGVKTFAGSHEHNKVTRLYP